jgi:hypothetical protein
MSTPSNKRDARREARKASINDAQAARRIVEDGATHDDTEDTPEMLAAPATDLSVAATPTDAPEDLTADDAQQANETAPVVSSAQQDLTSAAEEAGAAAVASASTTPAPNGVGGAKAVTNGTPVKKTTTGATASKTTSRPIATGATVSKTTSRPIGTGATAAKSVNDATATKTPTRPTASAATGKTATGATYRPATRGAAVATDEDEAQRTKRDARRESRLAALAQIQAEKKRTLQLQKRNQRLRLWGSIGAGVVGVALFVILIINLTSGPATVGGTVIQHGYGAGITCGLETTAVHYHTNLQIYVNGKNEAVPAGVGFGTDGTANQCLYWLHTHASDGVVHIEAPPAQATRKFKLGDFIAIWNLSPSNTIAAGSPQLTSTNFFGLPVDQQHPLTIYVDANGSGKFTKYTGNPAEIVLLPHENIWLEYGTQTVTPTPYTWPSGE